MKMTEHYSRPAHRYAEAAVGGAMLGSQAQRAAGTDALEAAVGNLRPPLIDICP
jgi:hypothetical protein